MIRTAISPRFAIRSFGFVTRVSCHPWVSGATGDHVLTDDDLKARLGRAGLAAPVRAEEVTGSTNATAVAMAEEETPGVDPGRGWRTRPRDAAGVGRTWTDVPGRALMFSFVLRPSLTPSRAGLLSLLAGAAMAEAIATAPGAACSCKWPNDLMLMTRRSAGSCCESGVDDGVAALSWSSGSG